MNDLTVKQLNQLAAHAAEIRKRGKRMAEDVVEIGRRLTECKDLAGHGGWLPWLEREFGWKERTAQNFMRVYEMSESANFADLSIPVSSLYLLAAPSTPEPARAEVLERAEAGEQLSHQGVKKIVRKHTPQRMTESQRESERRAMRTGAEALFDHPSPEPPRGPTDWQKRIPFVAPEQLLTRNPSKPAPTPATAPPQAAPEPAPAPKPTPSALAQADMFKPAPPNATLAPQSQQSPDDQERWRKQFDAFCPVAKDDLIKSWDHFFPGWANFEMPPDFLRRAESVARNWPEIAARMKGQADAAT
jgi:hypothetical protein